MQYGYIRMGTEDAQTYNDLAAELEKFSVAKIFADKNATGTEIQPELAALLEELHPRDEIITHACTSLSTDEVVLQKIIARIRNKKASVRFLDLSGHGMENPALRALKAQNTQRWY